jgi:putative protease
MRQAVGKKPELLAPAGGPDAAFAALKYGADAIYCGLPRFSARADAENFTLGTLNEVVGYSHSLTPRRRVYAAVNTLVLDCERPELLRMLFELADIGVDALIVQDAGVAAIARRFLPGMRLHASTQMAAHSVEGAKALKALGFARVVLARELSLGEIREVAAAAGIEVETFIHGALCYSYSGLCLFSSHAMGRSGNRGRCAYCCREAFEGAGAPDSVLPFSMRDLALGLCLDDLVASGAASLKIEGRMKSALYVASVTDYYRRLLDGDLRDDGDRMRVEEDLRTVFSRPWTVLYADGKPRSPVIDPVNVGHRGARIGVVEAVRQDRFGRWLAFRTARALEKHDGIQVDLPGQTRPFGFAVDRMRETVPSKVPNTKSAITVQAGARIEIRLPDDAPELPEGAPVYCASSQAVKRAYPAERPRPGVFRQRHEVRVTVDIGSDRLHAVAQATGCPEVKADVSLAGPFDAARQAEKTQETFRQAFERTGDTEWRVEAVAVGDPEKRFVPVSQIHGLRRELCGALSARRTAWQETHISDVVRELDAGVPPARVPGAATWSVRAGNPEVLLAVSASEPVAPDEVVWHLDPALTDDAFAAGLGKLAGLCRKDAVRLAVPPIVRSSEAEGVRRMLHAASESGLTKIEIGNVGGLQILADAVGADWPHMLDVTADWTLYVTNRQAAELWFGAGVRRVTLSPEDEGGNMDALVRALGERAAVILCQCTPLFISETPPAVFAPGDADGLRLKGKGGQVFVIRRDGRRYVTTDARPFCIADRLPALEAAGVSHLRVDLTHSSQDSAAAVALWRTVRSGRCPSGSHDGNYKRGLA